MTAIDISAVISGIVLTISIIYSLNPNKQTEFNKKTEEQKREEREGQKEHLDINAEPDYTAPKKIGWIPAYEYNAMSAIEKNQLELDRYRNKPNKTNYEVGLEYERYIGYLWEKQFYDVVYYGAAYGVRDRGIDLIAMKDGYTYIIQCKRWSRRYQVHENAVFQLAGTIKYLREKKGNQLIRGVIVTSTGLSQAAKDAASKLEIKIYEDVKMDNNYPCIKCTTNEMSGQKIYLFPNDTNYDNCKMANTEAFYAYTVKEAEDKGFRRINSYRGM